MAWADALLALLASILLGRQWRWCAELCSQHSLPSLGSAGGTLPLPVAPRQLFSYSLYPPSAGLLLPEVSYAMCIGTMLVGLNFRR